MKRVAIQRLKAWKESLNRKPLILSGARQVGKTWLMKAFARDHFKNVAYINFDGNPRMKQLFSLDYNIPRLLSGLQAETATVITPGETLVIFDEIQTNPAALTSLKYFCEEASEYAIIAAGSLLGVSLQQGTGFPVGKVDTLDLYPMSFTEFLEALGEHQLVAMLESRDWELITAFKSKYSDWLRNYYFVGGMPEAVAVFSERRAYSEVRQVQHRLLRDYERDFSKHAPKEIVPRLRLLWNSMPAQLSKENKKFFYGMVREGARAKDFEAAMQWLIGAGLIYKVDNVSKPNIPLSAYVDAAFKLFTLDVGLLTAQCGLDAKTLLEGNAIFTEFKGALTEQYVQQQLRAACDISPNYWSSSSGYAEIDFLFQVGQDIIPVEVKAEENLRAKSLKTYHLKFSPKKSIRTSMSDYRKESWLVNLPLYAIGQIQKESVPDDLTS
jgi:uncharacterized protein